MVAGRGDDTRSLETTAILLKMGKYGLPSNIASRIVQFCPGQAVQRDECMDVSDMIKFQEVWFAVGHSGVRLKLEVSGYHINGEDVYTNLALTQENMLMNLPSVWGR